MSRCTETAGGLNTRLSDLIIALDCVHANRAVLLVNLVLKQINKILQVLNMGHKYNAHLYYSVKKTLNTTLKHALSNYRNIILYKSVRYFLFPRYGRTRK